MPTDKSQRRMGRMLLLVLMAILCICQSGCFRWTTAVWEAGDVSEENYIVSSVRMSPEGDLCVIYEAGHSRKHFDWSQVCTFFDALVGSDYRRASRAIILTAEDLQRLTARRAAWDAPFMRSAVPEDRVLPPKAWKLTFDQDRVDRETAGWREVPVILFWTGSRRSGQDWRAHIAEDQTRKRKMWAEARDTKAAFQPNVAGHELEIPDGEDGRMLIELPIRRGCNPWNYPVRILLTPPALAADLVEGVVKAPLFVWHCVLP
jgi:hypothetical protein